MVCEDLWSPGYPIDPGLELLADAIGGEGHGAQAHPGGVEDGVGDGGGHRARRRLARPQRRIVAPFEQHRARLARFLVASPWMRTGYSSAKVGAFCGLALAHAFLGFPADTGFRGIAPDLLAAANALAWVAVLFCIVRGVPVIVEGLRPEVVRAPTQKTR